MQVFNYTRFINLQKIMKASINKIQMIDKTELYHYSFLLFLSSFIFAIFWQNIINNFEISIILLFLITLFYVFLYFYSKNFGVFFIVSFLWLLAWINYSYYNLWIIENNKDYISNYLWKNHNIEFVVENIYKKSENYTVYIASIDKIDNKNFKNKNIKVLLKISWNYQLSQNTIINSKTKLESVENFSSNFNYERFLESKNIFAQSYLYTYQKVWFIEENIVWKYINLIRNKFLFAIKSIFPPDEANLLSWILIWERTDTTKEIQNNFNNSGLTHIVAVSGFNITIIIVFLTYILKIFPIFLRSVFISLWVIWFVLIVWDNIAAIRAAIMWLSAYFILISGRTANSFVVLLLSAFALVLYNPLIINYDISFELSFLAVLGLIFTKDFFDRLFLFLPKVLAIRESFVLTLRAFSFTLPIMIVYFGQVSILSPFANLAVWWTLPFTMLFGFIRVIFDFFSHNLSYIVWFIARWFLRYILEVAAFFWNGSFSVIKLDFWNYAFYFMSLYYIVLIFLILMFYWKEKEEN